MPIGIAITSREQQGEADHLHRHRQALENLDDDGPSVDERRAERAVEHELFEPQHVLHGPWFVEAVHRVDARHNRRSDGSMCAENRRRAAGRQRHHGVRDDTDEQEQRNRAERAPHDVRDHGVTDQSSTL